MFMHHDSKEGINDMQARKLFETLKDCVVRSANGKQNIKPKKNKNNNNRFSKPSVTSSKLSAPSVSTPPSFEECSKLTHQPKQECKGVANTNLIKVLFHAHCLCRTAFYFASVPWSYLIRTCPNWLGLETILRLNNELSSCNRVRAIRRA
ncbi:hypothetical protein P8452_16836 [Trifolium repens]|nr:hypothetical protein P8452_16836 [Trifolium repens]